MPHLYLAQLPNRVRQDPKRSAEVKFYENLRLQLDQQWVVFYSVAWLGLNSNGSPPSDGEIDFLVAHPNHGILLIEVKGGRIRYDSERTQWITTDRDGIDHDIDPFAQVRKCKYALLEKIKTHPQWANRWIVLGHAVAFPDVIIPRTELPPDAPIEILIDATMTANLPARFIEILDYWHGEDGSAQDDYAPLIVDLERPLAPHTELPNPLSVQVAEEDREGQGQEARDLIIPRHGFTGAAWDPPKISTDVEKVGSARQATITFHATPGTVIQPYEENFAGISGLRAFYREDGELLVYNLGDNNQGFAICTRCGYADSEREQKRGRDDLPSGFRLHAPITSTRESSRCWQRGADLPMLRRQALAAREVTDVLMLDFSTCIGDLSRDQAIIWTIGQALQIAGARLLELDERELGVMTAPVGDAGRSWGAVVYDNVPGGAGHVFELLDLGAVWLRMARQAMYVNEVHHTCCNTACLDCLLTYSA